MTKYERLCKDVESLAEELFSETDANVIDLQGLPDSSITGMRLIRPSSKETKDRRKQGEK
ncbi:unnamed protein product [marine sediment metagenome]|uniref:Uncharacterized protein n=1 Tax=marine sediment metagenome TaxID=412755 RepID=X0WG31_9ZZZZ